MTDEDPGTPLVLLCLSVVYGAATFFCMLRVIRLHKFSSEWKQSKFFYVTLLLQVLLRTVSFAVLIVNLETINNTVAFILLSTPDSLFIVTYVLLIWQMLAVFFYAHETHSLSTSMLLGAVHRPDQSKLSHFIVFIIMIWVFVQGALYAMYAMSKLHAKNISREIGIVNLSVPAVCIGMMVYLQIKYSGYPTRSNLWKSRLHKINCATLL